jgi:SPP1 gp7 family putative phage head morphogenesis protein
MPDRAVGEDLARAQAALNIFGRLAVLRDCVRKTSAPLQLNTSSRLVGFADQPDDIQIYTSFDLPNTGAIEYIRNLTPVTKSVFDGLSAQYRNDAFTIAGVTDQRTLAKIRDELGQIIAQGGTAADFRHAVAQLRTDAGVEALTSADIDNVFQTQTQKAYASGRYEQMTDDSVQEALPYWQFWTVGDDRVRPEHRVLDLFTAKAIDPVWRKIYPPCGWGCRCSVVPLVATDAPEGSDTDGMLRLPVLAIAKVPQPGYQGVLAVAA